MAARTDADCNVAYYGVGLNELLDEANKPDFKQDSLVWHNKHRDNRQSQQLNRLSDGKRWLDNLVLFNRALKHRWVF